ncbi:hypothetical protein [Alkalicoccobacillus porphyridii]|uniref:Uncharacterized protein n=1 Tax=Alkalicoccobacillus porphyridii TaxID=2597270 RepID=A0A554A0I0_9BACI|nr:hypothetical protein [Alkalicoccobacillus porphyridii]TSB47146.1 hypothetical protein FN960_09055 [Alkalicoccobacillus porphyridii]
MSDTYFRVYSGLMSPEHRERIGKAIWVFLWLIDRTTGESKDGQGSGVVFHGNPVPFRIIHDELGIPIPTVKAHCDLLKKEGYISVKASTRGNIIHVMKSKKWNKSETDHSNNGTSRSENGIQHSKNETHHSDNGTQDSDDHSKNETERSENGTEHSKNDPSILKDNINNNLKDKENKELKEAATNSESMKIDLLNEFVRLRGSGFNWSPNDEQSATEILNTGVPVEKAIELMQEMFSAHQPKHSRDRINSLSYCVGYILDKHQRDSDNDQTQEGPAAELAEKFLQSMLKIMPDFSKPDMAQWTYDMQRILNSGRSPKKIIEVMEFAHADAFWKSKIIAPGKLVDKARFDSLAIQKQSEQKKKFGGRRNERKDQMPKWFEEEKNNRESQTPDDDSNEQTFEDMLRELRERKQQHTY